MKALEIVYAAIDVVNEQIIDGEKIAKSPDTILLGDDGKIDSLTLVNLVVAVEDHLASKEGVMITLVDEETFSSGEHLLRTVGSLATLIERKMKS
jgi:acyl carrier protein